MYPRLSFNIYTNADLRLHRPAPVFPCRNIYLYMEGEITMPNPNMGTVGWELMERRYLQKKFAVEIAAAANENYERHGRRGTYLTAWVCPALPIGE